MAGHTKRRTPKQIAARKQKPSTIKRLAKRAAARERAALSLAAQAVLAATEAQAEVSP